MRAMIFYWSILLPGLLLLLFPAEFLLSKHVKLRSFETFTSLENSPRSRPWWWVPVLFVDPLRGFGGAWLVKNGLGITVFSGKFFHLPAQWAMAAVLILSVFVQMFTRRDDEALLAPIGFLAGAVALLLPLPVALISYAMAIAAIFGLRAFAAFFIAAMIMIPLLGVPFRGNLIWLGIAAIVMGLPVLTSVVSGRTLELPTLSDPNKAKLSPIKG